MNIYLVAAVWMGMALAAALISIRLGISVALVEILVGAIAANVPFIAQHVDQTAFTTFLASIGSVMPPSALEGLAMFLHRPGDHACPGLRPAEPADHRVSLALV